MKKLNLLFLLLMSMFTYQMYLGQNFTVTTCSTGVASNTYGPMNSNSTADSKNRTAFILPASQLTALNGGTITGTYFRRLATTGSLPAGTNFKIYLKQTALTDFGSSALDWATETASATLVYDSDPGTAVGSSAGFKQFVHTSNFVYTTGTSLAVFVEYSQTTAPTTSVTWDYEYGTTCISTTNNNTTKYNNTTGALSATLSTSNYRRPVIAFDVTYPPAVSAPACTTMSAPAANATNVSVTPTFTWASVGGQNGATSYLINLGTTPGGTDVMNGVDVGNVTTYTIPAITPLNFNQLYYVTVIPKNGIGNATGCTERSFTTGNITCPAVTAPTASAIGVSTMPTITWTASPGASGYRISMGTTSGGTDILNNVDVGNVVTYTLGTALLNSTTYYYTVNAYNGATTSASCTVRNFTTVCSVLTPNYTNNFATFPGTCWSRANGGSPATAPGTGTTNYWIEDGFLNVGATGAARINLYSTGRAGWLLSPSFNLTAGGYRVKFDYGLTAYSATTTSAMGSDDVVQFVVSTDGGTTWTVLQTWNAANAPSNTLNQYTLNLASYTGANTMFALFGSDGTVDDTQDYEFFVDNFVVETIPTCETPVSVMSSAITINSATLSWTASTTVPANGYEVYYSTVNTAPTATTVLDGTNSVTSTTTNATISGLMSSTVYYYWVRSVCSATDKSAWSISGSFTTLCVGISSLSENFDTTSSSGNVLPNCWSKLVTGTSSNAYVQASTVMSAPNNLYIYGSSSTEPVIVKLPNISNLNTGNYAIKFKGRANFTVGGKIDVGYMTDPANAATFVTLGTYTTTSTTTVDNYYLAITGVPAGVTTLALRNAGVPANSVLIDDVMYDLATTLSTNNVASPMKENIKAYPNPFTDVLNISDVKNVKTISIVDIAGRLVKTIEKPSSALQLRDLNSGMYMVILNMNDGSRQTIKAIKK
ncbi:hypothetical protein CHRY9390_02551 [Chryseobacterium aquaeductus]|uniref:Fibronectin type-III domain-containing protein n=1 Tax=Chryseobacterium aquaeductus TaxID=2675056 RepID=A0A9N8MI01_9FLAO|nr:T9SS type A sorting domain-containing protein [Chryseobacterium aquaeductus]CAA7331835.1 hypothetical protein CHRY9390_02551 [Chryseobacterium potabilaquae]CAD7812705.1 hypothetical protein CHRY9390_02551 [Chryseobacterium aquaeductus]